MNLKSNFLKFITNKTILNIIIVISVLNIVGYIALGNMDAVFYFILLGLLVGNFSKNLTITLIIPLILVNLFVVQKSYVEGFTTDGSGNQIDASNNPINPPPVKVNNADLNSAVNNIAKSHPDLKTAVNKINQSQQDPKSKQGLPITPIDHTETTANTSQSNAATEESFEVGRGKRRGGYDIDYASTVEEAYNELNKIIGSDGIKQLTSDTQNLMKQQLQLADAMNSMTPLIQTMAPLLKQAQGLFGNLGGENAANLGNIAKQLTGGN
jgi:hypothetical protein